VRGVSITIPADRKLSRGAKTRDTLARAAAKHAPESRLRLRGLEEETLKEERDNPRRSDPMKKYAIAVLLTVGLMTPALAAEFYVAQSTSNHKCSIVSQKPDGKSLTLVGSDGYKTRAAAETAMKGMTQCKA
jgi:hypothetical protein